MVGKPQLELLVLDLGAIDFVCTMENTSIRHSPGKEFMGSNLKQTPSLGNFRVRIPTFGKRGYNSFMICKREVRKQETYIDQWRYTIPDTID